MTSTLVLLGDSLFDAQNTFTLASMLGEKPFSESIYDGGGNTKLSDGLVLGEQIAVEMGADRLAMHRTYPSCPSIYQEQLMYIIMLMQALGQAPILSSLYR